MGVLKKPYEISIWEDVLVKATGQNPQHFEEKKILIVGSNEMISQSRAMSPKLVTNINGTNTLTFDIYYRYKDNITGETVDNPFAPFITNERKIKLKYGNEWYDLLIKNVKIDTTKHTYSVSASDQYIVELSRNGFNFTFDPELQNNVGSVQTLAQRCLQETDWQVPSFFDVNDQGQTVINSEGTEFIPDLSKEALVILNLRNNSLPSDRIYKIDDSGSYPSDSQVDPSLDCTFYGFYSCCKEKASRFSFLAIPSGTNITKDDERVITNKGIQYFIDLKESEYIENSSYGIYIPYFFDDSIISISSEYRGARYNYTPDTKYNPVLKQYVTTYMKDDKSYYGFSKTKYDAPILINNIVTNPNTFKSTSGWHSATTATTGTTVNELRNVAVRIDLESGIKELLEDLKEGTSIADLKYTSKLKYTTTDATDTTDASGVTYNTGVIYNTGFFDNRQSIENIVEGQKYVIKLKAENLTKGYITIGSFKIDGITIDITTNCRKYAEVAIDGGLTDYGDDGYKYAIIIINNSVDYTPATFKRQTGFIGTGDNKFSNKVYITLSKLPSNSTIYIEDFQIFPYVEKENEPFMDPSDQSVDVKVSTDYYLYDVDDVDGTEQKAGADSIDELKPAYEGKDPPDKLPSPYSLELSCEKRRAVTAKESNYFNIIQSICEAFQCWAQFKLERDPEGEITAKKILFHNYVGQDNFAGFRYGVNLKSIQRTDDSKQIVTKLIVKQNSNQFGKNGFCTITRAPSNVIGENYIYNLDYYISQGLLSATDWINLVYGTSSSGVTSGYFPRLATLNEKIQSYIDTLQKQSLVLMQAESDLNVYETGLNSANENYIEAVENFHDFFGFDWNNSTEVQSNWSKIEDNIKYIEACAEFYQAINDYTEKYTAQESQVTTLKNNYNTVNTDYLNKIKEKENLNKDFYSKFYRFIQEGTWNSEDYYDDELYYLDAQSTLYNSNVPKVTYSFSVLELSQLEGYQDYDFSLGDRTFVEDTEYFGYDTDGNPIREAVVLTEITYSLDTPDKNTIKVQNYKNQFQDLFKRITATVQSVQYSTGAYDKAAQLASASDQYKAAFLQDALNDSSLILRNLADQTVTLDSKGLIIIDGLEVNKMLRAVSGGILLTEDGGNTWKTGITANGIDAQIITSGVLNTGEVNIMYNESPTFRWDQYGLTAYDYTLVQPEPERDYITLINRGAGVRFDRFGIYGFDVGNNLDGTSWHPTDIVGYNNDGTVAADVPGHVYVRNHSIFELTKEGLYLSLAKASYGHIIKQIINDNNKTYSPDSLSEPISHSGIAQIGKVDDFIYNKWDDFIPYYEEPVQVEGDESSTQVEDNNNDFVKVVHIANNKTGDDYHYIDMYDDGTIVANNVKLIGNITATSGTIGGCRISGNTLEVDTANIKNAAITNAKIADAAITNAKIADAAITNAKIASLSANKITTGALTIGAIFEANKTNSTVKIGGFSVDSNSLFNSTTWADATVFMCTGTNSQLTINGVSKTGFAFGAGKSGTTLKFGVTALGELYAQEANIQGKITATSGTIGGCTIDANGDLKVNTVNIRAGAVTALEIADATITSAKIAELSADKITSGALEVKRDGVTYFSVGISSQRVKLGNWYIGNSFNSEQIGTDLCGSYHIVGDYHYNTRLSGKEIYTIYGSDSHEIDNRTATWYNILSGHTGSDSRYKKNISALNEKFDTFFDELQPITFQLVDNISNRKLIGFVAQEVVDGLKKAKIKVDDLDFLHFIYDTDHKEKRWNLNYSQFVPLNTWQIQKLKTRTTNLEEYCIQLENRIAILEAQLNENK